MVSTPLHAFLGKLAAGAFVSASQQTESQFCRKACRASPATRLIQGEGPTPSTAGSSVQLLAISRQSMYRMCGSVPVHPSCTRGCPGKGV